MHAEDPPKQRHDSIRIPVTSWKTQSHWSSLDWLVLGVSRVTCSWDSSLFFIQGVPSLLLGWLSVAPFLSSFLGLLSSLEKGKVTLLCFAVWLTDEHIHSCKWRLGLERFKIRSNASLPKLKGRFSLMTATVNFTCVDILPVYSERVSWLLQCFY